MSAKTLVSIILRLLGALWVLSAIIGVPSVILFAAQTTDSSSRHIMLGNAVVDLVWLILGCVLFFKNEQIAGVLFPNTEGELAIAATAHELQQVGFSLLAVYFGIGAVARLAGLLYQFARAAPADDQSRFYEIARRNPESLASTAVQLIVCVLLFFGSQSLATFWRRVRGRDDDPPAEEPGEQDGV